MEKNETIAEGKGEKRSLSRGYVFLLLRIGFLALAVWILFGHVFLLHRVSGQGMYPTIRDGDLVLAYRLQGGYERGDTVLCRQGDALVLGRIGAEGTDVIEIEENGSLRVNGTVQTGEILYPTYPRETGTFSLRIPEGTVYLLGDYRTQTRDSRDFGPVPAEDIQGRVILLVRRRGL